MCVHSDCSEFFCDVVDDCVLFEDVVEEILFCACCSHVCLVDDPSFVEVVGEVVDFEGFDCEWLGLGVWLCVHGDFWFCLVFVAG